MLCRNVDASSRISDEGQALPAGDSLDPKIGLSNKNLQGRFNPHPLTRTAVKLNKSHLNLAVTAKEYLPTREK